MTNLQQDLRYALRILGKSPGITAIAVLAMTMGIGMPTIMFTIINGVFRDLPVDDPSRVVRLYQTSTVDGGQQREISHHDFADWNAQQTSFEGLAGFAEEDVTLSGGEARPRRINAAFVTPNAFEVLGVQPILGRSFRPDDATPAATRVAIVSHGVWQSRFAGDAEVQGRVLRVDGVPYTVVGVMADGFGFPALEDVWLPLALNLDVPRADSDGLEVFGRLTREASVGQAGLELRTIAARLAQAYPETNREVSAGVAPYADGLIDSAFRRGLYTMFGAVSFVLLIACVNVANILLARAMSRSREIAVRTALGASRGRVISLFLIETLVVAVLGGVLGAATAWYGVHLFNEAFTSLINIAWVDVRIDGAVLAFVTGAVVVATVLAGVLPALQASSVNVNDALKDAPRAVAGGFHIGRFGKGLVVAEVALSCALLVVSGLMIKGVLKLSAVDFGMPVQEIVTGEVELPRQLYPTAESRERFFTELEAETARIPGVRATALMSDIPGTVGFRWPVTIEGDEGGEGRPSRVAMLTVTPGFLEVLGAGVIDGRGFGPQDRLESEPVLLINRSFADRYFPDRRAVGRAVTVGRTRRTVIGVLPDLFMGSMQEAEANGPGMYVPYAQSANVSMQLMVRTDQDPMTVVFEMRDVLERLDPTLALTDLARVDHLIGRETAVFSVFGGLFLFFGVVALFLAAMGLYGVMAFTVGQRSREWGVRIALGATGRNVVGLATTHAAVQLVIGLAIGSAIAGMLSMPLANFFYQVEPWDVTIFAAIAVLLSATGVLAAYGPVRRATAADPVEVLRG